MLEEKIRIGHSGHGYFQSKSFNSLLSRNLAYSKKMKRGCNLNCVKACS